MKFEDIILKSILQVRKECQFFAALMMFANIYPSKKIDTAATNGKDIYVNEDFLKSLKSKEQNALLLHEVLHVALLHVPRIGSRDKKVWNIAADIVVNDLIIRNTSFDLPSGAILISGYEDMSVEEIYETLLSPKNKNLLNQPNLIEDLLDKLEDDVSPATLSEDELEEITAYWKDKMQVIKNDIESSDSANSQGSCPLGMERELESVLKPEVDWRTALWKFIAKTPSDFDDLDRRFIYRGLYLEGLLTDSLKVSVCIDTSGSVSGELLDQFMAELKGITRSYPNVEVDLFYADHDLYGPCKLNNSSNIPKPKGFGGTSFVPFFDYLENTNKFSKNSPTVSVYLTDGYGDFPEHQPTDPILWVVPRDGLSSKEFPYGQVIRISTESW